MRNEKVLLRINEQRNYYYYYYYRYSALGPVWAETRAQSGDWYGSGMLHPGQFLRGSLPLLSPEVEQRNILHEIRKRKANWIGHILRRNCFLKQDIEGKIKGETEVGKKTRKKT